MYEYEEFEDEQLSGLNLAGEGFESCDFTDCEFVNCNLEKCSFVRCRFQGCTFRSCTVTNPRTIYSSLQDSVWEDCTLVGIDFGLLKPTGQFADPFDRVRDCRMRYCTFQDIRLIKFDFSGCTITNSTFAECRLNEAKFNGCKLEGTEFFRCDLQKSDFRNAEGYMINPMDNQVKGARFSYPDAVNLLTSFGVRVEW